MLGATNVQLTFDLFEWVVVGKIIINFDIHSESAETKKFMISVHRSIAMWKWSCAEKPDIFRGAAELQEIFLALGTFTNKIYNKYTSSVMISVCDADKFNANSP